jgi:peptidoglycan/LPS O-acetylase OafA/YrhL
VKTTARTNSFDLLRLAAALMVLWSHQFAFSALPEPGIPASRLGLDIFFAISGYLNIQSLLNSQSWAEFLGRRARRIYPALVAFSIFCVGLGLAVTTASTSTFWMEVPVFVAKNSTVLFGIEHYLPGVFEANPYPSAMNGSLWTLPSEIKLYIYLAIIAFAVRYKPAFLLAALAAFFLGFLIWFHVTTKNAETAYFQQFAILFLTGAMFAIIERSQGIRAAIVATIGLAAIAAVTTSTVSALPAIALAAVLVGKAPAPAWLRPPIDISYGVYLYAFPMQQLIASYGLSFAASLAISLCATTVLAVLSSLLIERPALVHRQTR